MEPSEDQMLITKCQKGDKQAFGRLVEKYMQQAYFTALGFVGSHDAALDLSQEAFIRAYRAVKRFDTSKNFFTWYYRILKNLSLNFIRDKKAHARSFSDIGENQIMHLADGTSDTAQLAEQNETKEMVWQAIQSLKDEEKEIILLKDFQDYSYKEIAEVLDIPIGTVMSRLYYARRALKNKIEKVLT